MQTLRKTRQPGEHLHRDTWITVRAAGRLLEVSQYRAATMAMQGDFGELHHAGGHIYVDRRLVEAAKTLGRHLIRRDREAATP
jgi:hypothetical protein